jgi:hypothetical protein
MALAPTYDRISEHRFARRKSLRASDTMIRTLSFIAAAVAVAGLAGCGGGGGNDDGGAAAPLATTTRTLQTGDSWQYTVNGSLDTAAGNHILLKTGGMTRSVGAPTGSATAATISQTTQLNFPGVSEITGSNLITYSQDATGIFQRADTMEADGNQENADGSGSQIIIPALWSDSTGISSDDSYSVNFLNDDGTTTTKTTNQEHFALTVVGQDTLKTPAGKFACWRCTIAAHYVNNGLTITGTAWWAPQLGTFVRQDTTETNALGTKHLDYTLISYHLAPSASV